MSSSIHWGVKWGKGVNLSTEEENWDPERQNELTDKNWILVHVLPKLHGEMGASLNFSISA